MMMITTMSWMLWLSVVGSNLQAVTSGDGTTTAATDLPLPGSHADNSMEILTNLTEFLNVTTSDDAGITNMTIQDGDGEDVTVGMATQHTDYHEQNETSFEASSTDVTTAKDVHNNEYFTKRIPNATDENAFLQPTDKTTELSTNESSTDTTHASGTKPTTDFFEKLLSEGFKSTSLSNPTLATETPGSETSNESSATPNLYINVSSSVGTDFTDTHSPDSLTSKTNWATTRNSTLTNTSSSTVPGDRILTTPVLAETTRPKGTYTTVSATDLTETDKRDDPSQVTTKVANLPSTVTLAVQQTSPDLRSVTKSTPATTITSHQVTGDASLTDIIDDEIVVETDEMHQETEYERSLRTRRVINHAALWITIGFVVVLVSYITVLVIYNRTRPEWQDPQRPYSTFENEAEDYPQTSQDNVDSENQDLIQRSSPQENRRDFSQCVDSRDFPPCDGPHEYLLYEDPTCMDSDICTDFTYRDQC